MQVIAITGASSFIGSHLVENLLLSGDCRLRLLIHRNKCLSFLERHKVSLVQGDLLQPETLKDFVESGCTVIHLAYLSQSSPQDNLAVAFHLAEACKSAGVKRLIHCSTAVVAGRVCSGRVTEATRCNPLKEYEITKAQIEGILLEKSEGFFETVIVRPTAVFGPGGKNLLKLADDLRVGSCAVNYLKSCLFQTRRMNLVAIDNVIAAISFLIGLKHNIDREVFIISDDEDRGNNYHDVAKHLVASLGLNAWSLPVVPLPRVISATLLRIAGRTNIDPSLIYDCGKLLSRGFRKPISFEEGLTRFTVWYRKVYCQGTGLEAS